MVSVFIIPLCIFLVIAFMAWQSSADLNRQAKKAYRERDISEIVSGVSEEEGTVPDVRRRGFKSGQTSYISTPGTAFRSTRPSKTDAESEA